MEPPSTCSVTVTNHTAGASYTRVLRSALKVTLSIHGLTKGSVHVMLTGDAEIQNLNKSFRKVDEPTDVLTFPSAKMPGKHVPHLGDIVISVEFAQKQAKLRNVTLEQEIAFLAIHGGLHLVGFDDEEDEDRFQMQKEMHKIAQFLELPNSLHWTSLGLDGDSAEDDMVSQ